MADVVCMGELLTDFVPLQAGVSLIDAPAFKKTPGGWAGAVGHLI